MKPLLRLAAAYLALVLVRIVTSGLPLPFIPAENDVLPLVVSSQAPPLLLNSSVFYVNHGSKNRPATQ